MADEHRHPDASIAQRGDIGGKAVFIARHIQPTFGGAFGAVLRHKAHRMGAQAQGKGLHFIGRRTFEIQRRGQTRHQRLDIGIPDVAAVFAQMRCNAIGTRSFGQQGRAQGIGIGHAPCISHGGDMINIHAKTQFFHKRFPRPYGCSGPLPSPLSVSRLGRRRAAASTSVAFSLRRRSRRSSALAWRAF